MLRQISSFLTKRALLILAGLLACTYALAVVVYLQQIPDLGLRTAFSSNLNSRPLFYLPEPGWPTPEPGDKVVEVGELPIENWTTLLNAPFRVRDRIAKGDPGGIKKSDGDYLVFTRFQRNLPDGSVVSSSGWCKLGYLPWEELAPTVLWFVLKMMLFLVGALVLWKRPGDKAAAQFFLLCVVTVGAYMGGYHWSHIATQPVLLLVFMVCAVFLPVVSLHFYLIFPRRKAWLEKHPRVGFGVIYGPPLAFLATLVFLYFLLRRAVATGEPSQTITDYLMVIRGVTSVYLVVAALWYVACVASLIHSFRTVADPTERNQVKVIMVGALVAMVPIGYSLYLAIWQPAAFGAGAATWPMFAASVCLTAAFAVSITRYRLMELDKILSSSVSYFLISFLAGLVYYAVVFLGTLIFSQVIAGPSLSEALTVSTTALLLMLALDLARSRFKKALDRRFSRDKSQLDRTLQRMGQAIQQLVDPPVLAQRLLQAATELLSVSRGSVYLRQGEPPIFSLAGSVGTVPPLQELSSGFPLIEALEEEVVVNLRARPGALHGPAERQLQFLGGEIAHPLAHEGRLLAFLVLGPKSLSPYRPEDLDLLGALAQITVLALESADGHRTIEQLNQELQAKVEKISEQQRRILALQTQLRRQTVDAKNGNGDPNGASRDDTPKSAAAGPGGIVGSGPLVSRLLHLVRKVAATDAVVLIRGESGTGKELLARAVHETSNRAAKPFVKVHCAALSANLLESELFGHVKGAFTGAHKDKVGRFELAHGGTLFLDEIGDISLEVQTKLLRVLQEKAFERVGSSEPVTVDVRIIAATHQALEKLLEQGRFREDLFYRLNVFPVQVPPLRERPEDIPELALHFMRLSAQRCRKNVNGMDDDVLAALKAHPWPGNIRQLENVVERAVVICEGSTVTLQELPPEIVEAAAVTDLLDEIVLPAPSSRPRLVSAEEIRAERGERERRERELLVRALAGANGNKAEAARALGLARSTLISRLKKLGLS
jgi:transcriptional regulator with GAF, ATPase, and Fis domain